FPQWIEELASITEIDTGFRRCGGWYLADTAGERASLIGAAQYWQKQGITCQSVDAAQIHHHEPHLTRDPQTLDRLSAWWVPDECQIRSPDYLAALHRACLCSGVEIRIGCQVDDLRCSAGSAGVRASDQWYDGDRVIICGGVWTGSVAQKLQLQSSIVPVRGQLLLLKTDQPLLRSIVNVGQRYIICRDDGHTLIGSCEEEVGFQLGTDAPTLLSFQQFAIRWVPQLTQAATVKSWSGLRPMTFDGFPMIGRVPQMNHVFVAAGHFRSGIHLSPGTAVTLADLIFNQEPLVDLDSFFRVAH
ncbi:MAG: FAD-dependent oxidoreductase, partial [Pirellulales bacterium]|nr:FAD-dependent oxidoreductase [Pirellulales bacterium]